MAPDKSPTDAKFRLYVLTSFLCLWLVAICLGWSIFVFCYGDFEQRAQHQQQRSFDLAEAASFSIVLRELAMSIS